MQEMAVEETPPMNGEVVYEVPLKSPSATSHPVPGSGSQTSSLGSRKMLKVSEPVQLMCTPASTVTVLSEFSKKSNTGM
jgi:hypothetical protein